MSSVQISGNDLFCKVINYEVYIEERYEKEFLETLAECRKNYEKPYFFGLFNRPHINDVELKAWVCKNWDNGFYEIRWKKASALARVESLKKLAWYGCANSETVTITDNHAFILEYKTDHV